MWQSGWVCESMKGFRFPMFLIRPLDQAGAHRHITHLEAIMEPQLRDEMHLFSSFVVTHVYNQDRMNGSHIAQPDDRDSKLLSNICGYLHNAVPDGAYQQLVEAFQEGPALVGGVLAEKEDDEGM